MRSIVGLLVVLLLLALFLYFILAPAWLYLLGLEDWSVWWGVVGIPLTCGFLGSFNLPIAHLQQRTTLAINLLGVITPIALITWGFITYAPTFTWTLPLPALLLSVVYFMLSGVGEKGVELPALSLWGGAVVCVLSHGLLDDLPPHQLMICAFASQFISLAFMDVARVIVDRNKLIGRFDTLAFGGAGTQDALWSGPAIALVLAWVAQWLLWGGFELPIPPAP